MPRFLLAFSALLGWSLGSSPAQTPATEAEKQQVRQLLRTYEKNLRAIAKPNATAAERNAGKRELLTLVEDKSILVANDLDSLAAPAPVSMQQYVQELLPKQFPDGVLTTLLLEQAQFGPVKTDQVRRYDYLEVRVPKSLAWQTTPPADSNEVDTVQFSRTVALSFYVRFGRGNPLEKTQLLAVSKAGTAPTLRPLPPLVAWWTALGADWKAVLMKNYQVEAYPRESDLEGLLALRKLSIAKTPIQDATPLARFTELSELDCSQTAIGDLRPLGKLVFLEDLNVSRTRVTSLQGIDSLSNLIRLNGSFLKLKDIRPVAGLTKLEDLNFSDNEVTDLTPLAGLVQLKKLNFNNNQATTLGPLAALVNLEELRFGKNKVADFGVLTRFPNLVVLDCYSTGLDSAEPFRRLPKLAYLNCGANPIPTLDPLADHAFLVDLNVGTTRITHLNALRKSDHLEVLDFSNTTVTELGPVHGMDGLRVLKCQLTKVAVGDKDRFKKKHTGCQITYF
ncbi:MAG: leucine-rich repeat domain-containing protein [Ferruginibacter sp.]|nr:leucine-rich repeat domain-containing protein [Cytophagales bacterium]